MNHTVEFDDVCGHTHILRDVTLSVAHGRIGSFWKVKVDGRRGTFRYLDDRSCQTIFEPSDIDERFTRWEDEEKADYGVEALRREFRARLYGGADE